MEASIHCQLDKAESDRAESRAESKGWPFPLRDEVQGARGMVNYSAPGQSICGWEGCS